MRWLHPERGLLSPAEFIGVAEESQLIDEVGRFVLVRACKELAELRSTFPPAHDLRLAVNVSVRQLSRPGFAAELSKLTEELDMVPSNLAVGVGAGRLEGHLLDRTHRDGAVHDGSVLDLQLRRPDVTGDVT